MSLRIRPNPIQLNPIPWMNPIHVQLSVELCWCITWHQFSSLVSSEPGRNISLTERLWLLREYRGYRRSNIDSVSIYRACVYSVIVDRVNCRPTYNILDEVWRPVQKMVELWLCDAVFQRAYVNVSGVTPIGLGWTNARGPRGQGSPSPTLIFVYFNIYSVKCYRGYSIADFLWTSITNSYNVWSGWVVTLVSIVINYLMHTAL